LQLQGIFVIKGQIRLFLYWQLKKDISGDARINLDILEKHGRGNGGGFGRQ